MILHSLYLAVPGLVEVTIVPVLYRVTVSIQIGMKVIHDLTLILDIVQQFLVLIKPLLDEVV